MAATTNFGAVPHGGYFYDSGKLRKKIDHGKACDPNSPGHSIIHHYKPYQRVRLAGDEGMGGEQDAGGATTSTTTGEDGGPGNETATPLAVVLDEETVLGHLQEAGVETVEQYKAIEDPTAIKGVGRATKQRIDEAIENYING